jgi:ADP-ribose pyrophosphatase YjhB (NUDIX family)
MQQTEKFHPSFMRLATEGMSPERTAIFAQLEGKAWWRNTANELKYDLLIRPENWNGYLADLAKRPEVIGNATQREIVEIPRTTFGGSTMFLVQTAGQADTNTYEYHSWRFGPRSGAKGVVFVKDPITGQVTHFLLSRGMKFAPAELCWDCHGGFVEGNETLADNAMREIREELGVEDLKVKVVPLGTMRPDAGLTNNHPSVFVAFITTDEAANLPHEPVNPDPYELETKLHVFPIEQLPQLIDENDDAFFQTSVLRALRKGLLPLWALYGHFV